MSNLKFKNIYYYDHFLWSKFFKNAKETKVLDFFNRQRNILKGRQKNYLFRKYRRKLFSLNESEMRLSLRRLKKKRIKKKTYLKILNQKRSLKNFYNLKFTYLFKKIYTKVLKKNQKIYLNFLLNLENRLDSILVRSNVCLSNLEAQQLIKHKKILVNSKLIKSSNFHVQSNDYISLKKEYRSIYLNILRNRFMKKSLIYHNPKYIEINYKILTIIFLSKQFNINYLPFSKKFNINIKDFGYGLLV